MNKILATMAGVALTLATISTHANEGPNNKQYSLDITVPDNGGTFVGGRMFLSKDTAIEANGTVGLEEDGTRLIASGGLMKYLSHARVSPYLRAGGTVALYFGNKYAQGSDLRGYAGVGAEFMITEELSLRTSVNAQLTINPVTVMTSTSNLSLSFLF